MVRTGLTGIERDQALLAGSADVDISGTGVQAPTTARLEPGAHGDEEEVHEQLLGRVDDVTTGAVRLLALPTEVAPMDNAACRAAVAASIDRRELQEVLGGPRNAVRTSQLWPRGLPAGPEDPDPRPDHDAARAALEECGHPEGFSTVLAVSDIPSSVDVARAIARQLAEVGITAEVRPLDRDTFYGDEVGSPGRVKKNWYGIVLATWTADFPTPGSFLVPLVDGDSIQPVANTNYALLDHEPINELVDTALAATDAGVARKAWREVATQAGSVHPYVPLAENRIQLVAGQRLRNGLVMQPYSGYDLATAGVR
jgi:peptide/nickel transport system substrate-binding protein